MRIVRSVLGIICVLELGYACVLFNAWLSQTLPPQPDISHLHGATRDELRELQQRVIDDPNNGKHWETLAEAYTIFGFFAEADWCANHAVELNPESFNAMYWSALAFNQIGLTSAAIDRFERAIRLVDKNPDQADPDAESRCWYCIGRNFLREENSEQAEVAFRKAGDFLPARRQLAHMLLRSDRSADAIVILDHLLKQYPNDVTFYQLRARARDAIGNQAGARQDRDRAMRSDDVLPSDMVIHRLQEPSTLYGLDRHLEHCRELMRNGLFADAADRLRGYLKRDSRVAILSLLWQCEMHRGNAQQAIEIIEQLERTMGTRPERVSALGRAQMMLGRKDEAVKLWKKAARLAEIIEPHFELARYYDQEGRSERAEYHRAKILYAEGLIAWRENRLDLARAKLSQSVKKYSDQPHAWYYLGNTFLNLNEPERAERALKRCLELRPSHGRALDALNRSPSYRI